MSLYDDLDIKEDSGNDKKKSITKQSVVPGWSPGYKLLASTLQAKKASILQPKKQRTSHLAPVVDLKRHVDNNSPMQFNMQTGKLERVNSSIQPQATIAIAPITPQSSSSASSLSPFHGGGGVLGAVDPLPLISGVADEYDPLRPNEYDEVVKRKKEEKQKERESERRNRDDRREDKRDDRRDRDSGRDDRDRDRDRDHRDRDRERRRHDRRNDDGESEMERMRKRRAEDDEEEEIDRSIKRGGGGGAAIAPPSVLLEEPPVNPEDGSKSPQNMGMAMMGSVASKIMAKYGYKSGQGLGKSEQGMSTALYVEKTSKRGGKIIHEKDMPKESQSNTNLMKNPSKVILLQNMVGPGEVDEELEPETAEECSKYGKVNRCCIFEMPDLPEEESVRIFIEFERMESAIKAVVDLNGRFFGGRVVRANFYNLDKFRRLDYSSPVD